MTKLDEDDIRRVRTAIEFEDAMGDGKLARALTTLLEQNIAAHPTLAITAVGPQEEAGTTSRGYTLFRCPNEVGGHTYWSDEVGDGILVWDTCLVDAETLRLALAIEAGKSIGGAALPAIETDDEDGWPCEGCDHVILPGELAHRCGGGAGGYPCIACAPTYADMLAHPSSFSTADGEPETPEGAKAFVDAHVAAGGSIDDKIVSPL